MAKWRTDPSFQYTAQLSKPEGNQQPIRVSSRKTDLSPSTDKRICPLHQTNHDLNYCRAFRQKPIGERMDLLKKYKLCFRWKLNGGYITPYCLLNLIASHDHLSCNLVGRQDTI
jgi:hypothetical protein